jgi:MYXO-CTERM domain-containing protein
MPKIPLPAPARALVVAGCLLLVAPAAGYAVPCELGLPVGSSDCQRPLGDLEPPTATPELDSVVLFGAGLLGLGGVAVIRRRAASGPELPAGE